MRSTPPHPPKPPAHRVPGILLVTWALACLGVFIAFPGSLSVLHGSSLHQWQSIGLKLARIDAWVYLLDLIKAFIGMLVFALACLGYGLAALRIYDQRRDPGTTTTRRLAGFAVAIVIGEGLLSIVFMALAQLGALAPPCVASIVALGVAASIYLLPRPSRWLHADSPSSLAVSCGRRPVGYRSSSGRAGACRIAVLQLATELRLRGVVLLERQGHSHGPFGPLLHG